MSIRLRSAAPGAPGPKAASSYGRRFHWRNIRGKRRKAEVWAVLSEALAGPCRSQRGFRRLYGSADFVLIVLAKDATNRIGALWCLQSDYERNGRGGIRTARCPKQVCGEARCRKYVLDWPATTPAPSSRNSGANRPQNPSSERHWARLKESSAPSGGGLLSSLWQSSVERAGSR